MLNEVRVSSINCSYSVGQNVTPMVQARRIVRGKETGRCLVGVQYIFAERYYKRWQQTGLGEQQGE